MPLVKIELAKGKDKTFLLQLMNTVMACVQEVLRLSEDDKNIRIIEHDPELFTMRKPYSLLIEISFASGRSKKTKNVMYQIITDALSQTMNIDKESIFIFLNEQPSANWGAMDTVFANEIYLDCMANA